MKKEKRLKVITRKEAETILDKYYITIQDIMQLEYCGDNKAREIKKEIEKMFPQYDHKLKVVFCDCYKWWKEAKTKKAQVATTTSA